MSVHPNQSVALYGEDRPARQPVLASAGPVRFVFEDGMIKHVRLGSVELVRRVYFAVRDGEWDTVYPELSDVQIEAGSDAFRATFRAFCRKSEFDYEWRGAIDARADGTIQFRASGEPKRDFGSNRIGLCLLLGAETLAGRPFTLTKSDGRLEEGRFAPFVFPHLVGAQFTAIRYQPPDGPLVECRMEGAVFDMEDQRLYMDTTYKAYAPLPHEYPHARTGEALTQTFTLTLPDGVKRTAPAPGDETVTIDLGKMLPSRTLPPVGLTLPVGEERLTEREIADLQALGLGHTRVALDLQATGSVEHLAQTSGTAARIAPVLLLSIQNANKETSGQLVEILRHVKRAGISRAMIEVRHPDPSILPVVREAAPDRGLDVLIGGPGSEAVSAHPDLQAWAQAGADFLCWAGSPAIHQEDDETLMENTSGIAQQMAAARRFAGQIPLAMGPFQLDGPWPRSRPSPRHTGFFAATWIASVLKHLGESGASFATLFDATGPAGVMYRQAEFAQPGFDGTGRKWYPVYEALRSLLACKGSLRETRSSDSMLAEAVAVTMGADRADCICLLINKTHVAQPVAVAGLTGPLRMTVFAAGAPGEQGADLRERDMGRIEAGGARRVHAMLPPYGLAWLSPE